MMGAMSSPTPNLDQVKAWLSGAEPDWPAREIDPYVDLEPAERLNHAIAAASSGAPAFRSVRPVDNSGGATQSVAPPQPSRRWWQRRTPQPPEENQ